MPAALPCVALRRRVGSGRRIMVSIPETMMTNDMPLATAQLRPAPLLFALLTAFLLAAGAGPAAAQSPGTAIAASVTVGPSGSRTSGSGQLTNDVRALAPFSAIRVDGAIDVVLRQTDREQATVRFDDNLVSQIETIVSDTAPATLLIRFRPDAALRSSHDAKVTVEFKSVSSLALSGSGDARIEQLSGPVFAVAMSGSSDVKADSLDVEVLGVSISGSGDFTARGRAAEQGFSVAGSGDIRAGDLIGQTVKVRIAGSGDVHVHALQMLDVAVAGSGDVVYRGTPVIRKSVAGSGSVRKAN